MLDDKLYYIRQIINENSVPSEYENHELVRRYKSGDISAKEELVKRNTRLILSRAFRFINRTTSLDISDLYQHGAIGFIRGLERYDEALGSSSISTYIVHFIDAEIREALKKDHIIHLPFQKTEAGRKYDKIIKDCINNGTPIPDDKEMCRLLGVNQNTLEFIKTRIFYNPISLDFKVTEKNDTTFKEMIRYDGDDGNYDKTLDRIVERELMAYLKENLRPSLYYITYYRFLSKEKITQDTIGETFGITRARAQQLEKKAARQIKKLIRTDHQDLKKKLSEFRQKIDIESYDVLPINVEQIILYLFFRNEFTAIENRVYRFLIQKKYLYGRKRCAEILNLSVEELLEVHTSIRKKINTRLSEYRDLYEHFKDELLRQFKTGILTIDLDIPSEQLPINYKDVSIEYDGYSYEQLRDLYDKDLLSPKIADLLKQYFGNIVDSEDSHTLIDAEREINHLIFEVSKITSDVNALDLIKEEGDKEFSLSRASRSEILELLKTYGSYMSVRTKNALMTHACIKHRDLMNSDERMEVLSFLADSRLDEKRFKLLPKDNEG